MLLPLLFGDDTRTQVLELLSRHPEGFTQRAIASRLGRSPSHVNKLVQAFQALDIVHIERENRVQLDPESPLYEPIVETLDRFRELRGHGRLLRTVIRAANDRFGERYYVGGYVAATRALQPIDFHSDRCDLYVKELAPRDDAWVKPLQRLTPYDVTLHETDRIRDHIEEDATIDEEPCLVAKPEIGVVQCLADDTFPRYGAFLLLVQALDEFAEDAKARLEDAAQATHLDLDISKLIDYAKGRMDDPPPGLTQHEARDLRNALNTVQGGP